MQLVPVEPVACSGIGRAQASPSISLPTWPRRRRRVVHGFSPADFGTSPAPLNRARVQAHVEGTRSLVRQAQMEETGNDKPGNDSTLCDSAA